MTIRSINPKNGEILHEYSHFDVSQIEDAITCAQDAFMRARGEDVAVRVQKMSHIAQILEDEADYLAHMITDEMGKTLISARAEVLKCANLCRYYAQSTPGFLADKHVKSDFVQSYVRYLPLGVVLAVMPWNFPFWQVFRAAVPAIMAGNAVLLKHASNVSGCALAIEEIFGQGGFEKGIFQSLLIEARRVEAIIADPRVRAVTLTGSEGAGASVAAAAGKYIKPCILELGGSDPFIVMPSADITQAVQMAVRGRVQNNGQTCIAAKRMIVHENIYERFKDDLIRRFEELKVGDPLLSDTDVGPLASFAIREELEAQVQKTIEMGGVCLSGCHKIDGDGYYYRPGILENVHADSPAYRDELFGPVAVLFKVKSMAEAVALANDTRFGLGAAIFTQDQGEIEIAASQIDAGCSFVNALVASDPKLPFGGVKSSGFGRELSENGIHAFCNIKTICVSGVN